MNVRYLCGVQNAIAALVPVLLPCFLAATSSAQEGGVETLGIRVAGISREYVYTNGRAAFLFGETAALPRSSWHGFNVCGRELLDGTSIVVNDSLLPPTAPVESTVYPDFLRRSYPGGVTEEIHPLDSLDAFVIIVRSPRPVACALVPWLSDVRSSDALTTSLRNQSAAFARKVRPEGSGADPAPVWLALHSPGATPATVHRIDRGRFAPLLLSHPKGRVHLFVIAAGKSREEAIALAERIPEFAERAIRARRDRMDRLLAATEFHSGNRAFDRALAWAKLSLDALVMNQGSRGIFAGLPWFNNYWGRDTFISLPGAALVTGRYSLAREILLAFAAEQQRDSMSTDFGRIPNFVGPREKAYNTADGTPRFVVMARATIERSGDPDLLRLLYPVVIRSIEGTLRYHSDSLGFLTHGDAETWMDAVGPDGPWSPRGNRANDIQALWKEQLETGIWFATQLGDAGSAVRWNEVLQRLKRNFPRYFLRGTLLADHIRADGSPDLAVRPNQIFAGAFFDDSLRAVVLHTVVSKLTYSYGVASLSQEEENFHPYHQNPPFYPKDAAYHNGTVWTWLQGPVISELCRYGFAETAWRITEDAVDQILTQGAVGTQSELLDALPRPGRISPAPSGTVSQAWNLAEFVRNVYDDYLGVRVDGLRDSVSITPSIPVSLRNINARIPFKGGAIHLKSWIQNGERKYALRSEGLARPPGIILRMPKYPVRLPPPRLAEPRLQEGLAALQGPSHPLLSRETVRTLPTNDRQLVSVTDPEGDDTGVAPGTGYTYPTNPLFLPGSFDLRGFEVDADTTLIFFRLKFRALSNPGWHPEYGFQLTFAAIAIDTDGIPGSGAATLPSNASATLPRGSEYERIILIGGGVKIEDARGAILAEYSPVPEDVVDPIGDTSNGEIRFALPKKYFGVTGELHGWRITVVAGAQDDHGGAGLGEFRTVNRTAGEWNGGGRLSPDFPNLFDILVCAIP